MLKVFQATDKTYSSNGDLIVNPLKAQVHKEDNGEFYLDLETPFNEKEVSIAKEEGTYTTINGSATIQNVDTSKLQEVIQLQGNTTQEGTPTPSSPQPINVVSGRQEVVVAGKNLCPAKTFTSLSSVRMVSTATAGGQVVYGIPVIAGQTYTASFDITVLPSTDYRMQLINSSNATQTQGGADPTNIIERQQITCNQLQRYSVSITTTQAGYLYLRCVPVGFTLDNIQIEKGTATTYEAYKGQSYEINLGKNLFNKSTISSITNGTISNDVITSNAISSNYGGVSSTISGLTLEAGTYYISLKVKRDSGTSGNKLTRITLVGIDSSQITMIDNPNITNEYQIYSCRISPTTQITLTNIGIQLQPTNVNAVMSYTDIMISKDSDTSYSPYKTPIELCEIGDYQDFIKKGTGKNLLDINNYLEAYANGNTGQIISISDARCYWAEVKPNQTYTYSREKGDRLLILGSNTQPEINDYMTVIVDDGVSSATTKTFTNGNFNYILIYSSRNTSSRASWVMLEEGQPTSYEPYGMYNKWYIEKQIGKVVLNGSEEWNSSTANYYTVINDIKLGSTGYSNYFINSTTLGTYGYFRVPTTQPWLIFMSVSSQYNATQWKNWLSTHNTTVYYELATPTYTEITDSELISQLEAIKLINGLNNITISSAYLSAPITDHYNFIDGNSYSIRYNDYLIPNNIIVANTPQGNQAFRIKNVEKNRRKIKIKANHVFYDSKDYLIQDSYVVDKNCNDALDHLNNATDNISPFTTISNITTIDSYRCVRKSLFEAIQVVIERWGGHLVRNNWTIGVYDTIGQDNGVVIRYAKNLKEITASYNWDEVVTKLLPVGKDGILLNAIDPTASVYVESTTQYDIPYTKTLSFSQDNISEDDYKDEEGNLNEDEYKQALVNDLMEKGQSYVQDNSIPKVNYTLSANVEKVSDIGDTIEVIDEKLGINIMTNIISYDYDCILDKYIELEFGNFTPTLSGLMETITTATEKIVEEGTNNIKITLDNDLKEATDKIWNALGNSYVIYEGDKILVVDSLPKETATNVIMINNGGIGFSNTGITGTFNSAWTIDNVLNMEQINVINMTADLIKGGTLKLGNNINQNGQIEVYDEANTLIAELNKNGLKMYGVDGSYVLMNNQVGFSGYDRNDNPIYWVNGDEFHMKKSVIEEEITLCNKMRFIPITITDGNNQIVNDGIGLVSVLGGGN